MSHVNLTDKQLKLYKDSKRKLNIIQIVNIEWWNMINSNNFNKYIERLERDIDSLSAFELTKRFGNVW